MFPYADTTYTGSSKIMGLISRRNNFIENKVIEMEFSVTCSTNHTFHTYIRRAQRSDRSYPTHRRALFGVLP